MIPVVGFGTSRLAEAENDVVRLIKQAVVDSGYRHIDTADL